MNDDDPIEGEGSESTGTAGGSEQGDQGTPAGGEQVSAAAADTGAAAAAAASSSAATAVADPPTTIVQDGTTYRAVAPADQAAEHDRGVVIAERTRARDLHRAAAVLGDDGQAFAEEHVASGTNVNDFRATVIERLATRDAGSGGTARVRVTREEGGDRFAGITNAMRYRCNHREADGKPVVLTEAGRAYAGMTLLRTAEAILQIHGEPVRNRDPEALAGQALMFRAGQMTASDFPLLLADVGGKSLREAYDAAPRTFTAWARRFSATDFKPIRRLQIGEGSALAELPEGAQIQLGTIGESQETYSILDYAKAWRLSRKAIVNDDLDAFDRLPRRFGTKAAQLESDLVYAVITNNAVLSDGVALFAAGHNNLETDLLAVAGLGTARANMRKQTEIDGARINVIAAHLIVPAALEVVAQQLTADITPNVVSAVNPFRGSFKSVQVEPRLDADSATRWYLAADSAQVDTIEYAFLSGEDGPQVMTEENANRVLGIEISVWEAFGTGAIDFRGLHRSGA